jgi:hypothetical protein
MRGFLTGLMLLPGLIPLVAGAHGNLVPAASIVPKSPQNDPV